MSQGPSFRKLLTPSFRDGPKDQTSDVQVHIGESQDSGFTVMAIRDAEIAIEKEPARRHDS